MLTGKQIEPDVFVRALIARSELLHPELESRILQKLQQQKMSKTFEKIQKSLGIVEQENVIDLKINKKHS